MGFFCMDWGKPSTPCEKWCGALPGYNELGDVQHRACCGGVGCPIFTAPLSSAMPYFHNFVKKGAAPRIGNSSRIQNGIQFGILTLCHHTGWFELFHYSYVCIHRCHNWCDDFLLSLFGSLTFDAEARWLPMTLSSRLERKGSSPRRPSLKKRSH